MTVFVSGAVEGDLDEVVIRRLVEEAGAEVLAVYGKRGNRWLRDRIPAFNQAAQHAPWLVLTDLDQTDCAPTLVRAWLPQPARYMCFRVAVRAVEAWLLADRERMARLLGVSLDLLPLSPDEEADPKQRVVNLARKSRRRRVQQLFVPEPESGRTVGPGYVGELSLFASDRDHGWRPALAAGRSPSLDRARRALERLIHFAKGQAS